jgi:hypothetical protein
MQTIPIASALAAACLTVSGCAGVGQQVLTNLEGCERHYNGVASAGMTGTGFSGSVKVDCVPPSAAPPTAAQVAAVIAPPTPTTP